MEMVGRVQLRPMETNDLVRTKAYHIIMLSLGMPCALAWVGVGIAIATYTYRLQIESTRLQLCVSSLHMKAL